MSKPVLFIHGAGEGAYKSDEKLAESLRSMLGSRYEVRYPLMENEEDAPYEIWVTQIKEELATMKGSVFLVGHSVGGSVLIKFLMENEVKNSIGGVFLIATPFWGGHGGWTYDGYEELVIPNQTDSKLSVDVPVFLYHSNDDEVVPFTHLALYAGRFPGARVREIKGRGHQMNNDLREVADDIKRL
jgi:uncharacterized protein